MLLAYALLLAMLFYFAIQPLLANIGQNIEKIQKEAVDQERRMEKIKEVAGLEKQSELIQKEKENMQVLAERDQIVTLIEMIEKIADETGNEIVIQVEEEVTAKAEKDLASQLPTDKYIKMKITISGRYSNFTNFVRKIESMKYWSDIISLQISAGKSDMQSKKPSTSPFQKTVLNSDDKEIGFAEDVGIVAIAGMVFYLDE